DLTVRTVRDGRAFSVRQVEVAQGDRVIFVAMISFHRDESGDDWYEGGEDPHPAGPGEVAVTEPTQRLREVANPFEIRHFAGPREDGFVPLHPLWLRHRTGLPADPLFHAAALTYASDLGVVMDARPRGSSLPADFIGTSLDHPLW